MRNIKWLTNSPALTAADAASIRKDGKGAGALCSGHFVPPDPAFRQPASAAHTALPSARRRASKTPGAPCSGLSCSLTDTVTERLPSGDDARNCV